jgi:hypothetical protein
MSCSIRRRPGPADARHLPAPPVPWPTHAHTPTRPYQVDPDTGVPVMFYTGARLRDNPACGPPNPPAFDNQLNMFETQLCAVADPGGLRRGRRRAG